MSGRVVLEAEVAARAVHDTAEQVRTTCSFARAERLLGREYHGRFLIELLQNAADAWRADPRSRATRSSVGIVVAPGPVLLVANRGAAMTPEVVIGSLGHIGASTKAEGEAIGHKGVGFKSVLEVCGVPEFYSGLQARVPGLAVRFDPRLARESILARSPRWEHLLGSVSGLDAADGLSAIPVLRYPHWVDELPVDVAALAGQGYDTVVRLPFDPHAPAGRPSGERGWLATVRRAVDELTDQILLLLGCFSEVRVGDQIAGTELRITPEWMADPSPVGGVPGCEEVAILRDGLLSSRWRLFRRSLPESEDLSGEVAVGLRYDWADGLARVVPAVDGEVSAPFHLFFPTRIRSGLPLLLHGYFEVDAARTGFYRGSVVRNEAILARLADLVAEVIVEAAADPGLDLVSLVNAVAGCEAPEDPLARSFQSAVLARLDDRAWIPGQAGPGVAPRACPGEVLVAGPTVTWRVASVFPPAYTRARVGLLLPEVGLSEAALDLIAARQPSPARDVWQVVGELCRPGDAEVWPEVDTDRGFLGLLDLIDALAVADRRATGELLGGLRGDPAARLLPVAQPSAGRALLPVPDPAVGVAGRRSRLVMARARTPGGEALAPPDELDLAFLPDGLLATEPDVDRAKPLGVRPFTVDNVLDRLAGIDASGVDPDALLRFLWGLLSRERASGFGTRRGVVQAEVFDPGRWFWCRPGRAREDETARLRQQRERYLAEVPLPARDGQWRPAGTLAFGADWADWLTGTHPEARPTTAARQRAAAYRDLDAISPGPHTVLGPPEVILPLLAFPPMLSEPDDDPDPDGDGPGELLDEAARDAHRHAFLLRLGVWEVPPIEAFDNRERAHRERFPWTGPVADAQATAVDAAGGWTFGLEGWGGAQHRNTYLAEDYRLTWSLGRAAERDPAALAAALHRGARLYAERLTAAVFCPQCKDSGSSHTVARHSPPTAGYPSWLALQLHHDPWIAGTLDGEPLDRPAAPAQAWWRDKPPTGSGLRSSPWRLLPVCGPATGVTDELRRLARVNTLADADLVTVAALLARLRAQHEAGTLPVDPGASSSARQAFIGLHRLAYERLAELAGEHPDRVRAALDEVGVLCELGELLVHRPVAAARHDDGRFSAYVRHFAGRIPMLVLPRDQDSRAARLGVAPFQVDLTRRGSDDGRDVTDQLRGLLTDRIPELLAIMVNHSLGTQTLELASAAFDERAARLGALTVRHVDDLVLDARVVGTDATATLGHGADQDLYLHQPTSSAPVLFHDLAGPDSVDRLRRRIAPHLAAVLANPAYTHTIALFLQADSDAEREEFLLELGISADEVDTVAARLGVVGHEQRQHHLRWYDAILTALGHPAEQLTLDPATLTTALTGAGLPDGPARALVDAGGGDNTRRDTAQGSPLRLLAAAGLDLADLDTALRQLGDDGLHVTTTRRGFARWLDTHARRLVAVLATHQDPATAKALVGDLRPPPDLALALDPALPQLLAPVIDLLATAGLPVAATDLATDPPATLAHLAGLPSVADLDAAAAALYDEAEQHRLRREHAAQWRREIRVLAVLARMGPAETRATVRAHDEQVTAVLVGPHRAPSDLIGPVGELFVEHTRVRDWLTDQLADHLLTTPPDHDHVLGRASQLGLPVDRLPVLQRALDTPRRDRARVLQQRTRRLAARGLTPTPPAGLAPATPPPPRDGPDPVGPKRVPAVKVEPSHDRRSRLQTRVLGNPGSCVVVEKRPAALLAASPQQRDHALNQILDLLTNFTGSPVDAARAHADLARTPGLDDEDLIDELTGLLHVATHSDAFGFDLLGWLPPTPGGEPSAVCLEVKSASGEGFHLTSSEWALAERFHHDLRGQQYAVLVVRRGPRATLPTGMDLLADPIGLHTAGHLRRDVDGYTLTYQTSTPPVRGRPQ